MQQNLIHCLSPLRLNHSILTLFLTFIAFICGIFLTNPFLHILPSTQESSSARCSDYSYGKWVWDERLPGERYTEKCPFLDPGFRCQRNGRPDMNFQKWRWQPHGCHLPRYHLYTNHMCLPNKTCRFDAQDFLRRSQNGRIVFAGDSIGRNQWESFICMLAQGVSNLVTVNRPPPNAPKKVKGVIQVDKLHWFSSKWVGADVLIFSVGH